ncbi:MAG: hypothetical protein AABZ58_02220, partial [Chloroflexota bacterium]
PLEICFSMFSFSFPATAHCLTDSLCSTHHVAFGMWPIQAFLENKNPQSKDRGSDLQRGMRRFYAAGRSQKHFSTIRATCHVT